MNIKLRVDNSQLLLRLRNGEKRLAYAVVNAINRTAEDIQAAERQRVRSEFVLRKPEFVLRQAAIIKPFASVGQGRLFAEISVGQKPRLLLGEFEEGGERLPFKGKSVAVPVIGGARASKSASVPEELFIQRLRFKRGRKGARTIWRGLLGTYLVPGVGIFQRRKGIKLGKPLYIFAHNVKLDRRLHFVATAEAIAAQAFSRRLQREIAHTLAFQQGRIGVVVGG